MTTYQFSRSGFLAGALLMAFTLLASAHAESVAAKVESLKGSAFYDNGNGAVALAVGAEISAGSLVTTSPDSEAVLRLGTSTLRVFGSTTVSLDRLNQEVTSAGVVIDTQIDLKDGTIAGAVAKFASALSKFEIKLPVGVYSVDASLNANSFYISAPDDIRIRDGSGVFVYNRDGVVSSARIDGGSRFASSTTAQSVQTMTEAEASQASAAIPETSIATQTTAITAVQTTVNPANFFISPTKAGN
jgi:hypothetical protein